MPLVDTVIRNAKPKEKPNSFEAVAREWFAKNKHTWTEGHSRAIDSRLKKNIFPSLRSGERPMSNNTVLAALRRMGYAREEMSGHGFRSKFIAP